MSSISSRFGRIIAIVAIAFAGSLVIATAPSSTMADDHEQPGIDAFQPIIITEQIMSDFEHVAEDLDPLTLLAVYMELQDFGSFETNLSEESFAKLDSMDELDAHMGGTFAFPDDLPAGLEDAEARYGALEGGFAEATFDVAKARRISELLDISPDWLPDPADHDELTVRVDLGNAGMAGWKSNQDKLIIAQSPMPDVDIPDALDIDLLIEIVLDDPRVPDELAEQLEEIDDWKRTLPVPVPKGTDHQEIEINGEPAFLVSMDGEGSAMIWESEGTLHIVAGTFDVNELTRIAESMS